jgi:hypothetical protein
MDELLIDEVFEVRFLAPAEKGWMCTTRGSGLGLFSLHATAEDALRECIESTRERKRKVALEQIERLKKLVTEE